LVLSVGFAVSIPLPFPFPLAVTVTFTGMGGPVVGSLLFQAVVSVLMMLGNEKKKERKKLTFAIAVAFPAAPP